MNYCDNHKKYIILDNLSYSITACFHTLSTRLGCVVRGIIRFSPYKWSII